MIDLQRPTPRAVLVVFCAVLQTAATYTVALASREDPEPPAPKDRLSLEQIEPAPEFPPPAVKTDDTSERARRQIEKAVMLFDEDRFAEAIQNLERALRYSPNSLPAHRLMARVSLQSGNTVRAVQHLTEALKIDEAAGETLFLLGRAQVAQEDWTGALNSLRLVLRTADLAAHREVAVLTHFYLGQALGSLGYTTAAIEAFGTFIELASAPWPAQTDSRTKSLAEGLLLSAYEAQGSLYEKMDRPLPAAEAFMNASNRDPRNGAYLEEAARLFARGGQTRQALQAAGRLAELDVAKGLLLLRELRAAAGESTELVQDLQALSSSHPHDFRILEELTAVHVKLGQTDEALSALRDFVSSHPQNAAAAIALSDLLVAESKWSESLKVLSGMLQTAPDPQAVVNDWLERLQQSQQAHGLFEELSPMLKDPELSGTHAYLIGRVAHAVGQSELALQALRLSEEKSPDLTAATLAVGEILLDNHEWESAAESARKVIADDDQDFRAYRVLGQALLGLDLHDQAAEALNHAIRLNRSDLKTMELLATVYELAGKVLQARHQYQIILEMEPGNGRALEALFLIALDERHADQVRQHLESMKEVPELQSTYRRCEALLKVTQDTDVDAYVSTLQEIADEHPQDIETRLQLSRTALSTRDYDRMGVALDEILRLEPDHFQAQHLRCLMQVRTLDYEPAIENLRRRLQVHPNRTHWQQTLSACLIADQRYLEAAEILRRYGTNPHAPADVRAAFRYDYVVVHVLADRPAEALEELSQWISDDPQNPILKSWLIDLHRLLGRGDDAVSQAEQWFRDSSLSERKLAHQLLLQAYQAAGRFAEAELLVLDRLEIDPEALDATLQLSEVLNQSGRRSQALELVHNSLLTARAKDELEDQLVNLYLEDHNYDAAVRRTRDRLERRGPGLRSRPRLQQDLCFALISAGRYEVAEQELNNWLRESPAPAVQIAIRRMLSWCYQLSGRQSLSLQQLEAILEMMPDDPGINNDLGYSWASAGMHVDRAEQMIRHAVAMEPRSAAYLDSLGWVLYKKGDVQGAHQWLTRATQAPIGSWHTWLSSDDHQRGADDPVIRDHLGDAAWRLQRKDEALSCWQRAVKLARDNPEEPPSPERRAILEQTPRKIEAIRSGGTPDVAPQAAELQGSG